MASTATQNESSGIEWVRRKDPGWMMFVFWLYIAIAVPYFFWRTSITNWGSVHGIVVYVAEVYGFITTLLFLFVTRKIMIPVHRKTSLNKTVDVLIPTYSEPIDVLEPVVIGATKIRGVHTVFVLDDGNRPAVRAMARRLGVTYIPRTTNEHAKAGNMNNGLKYTTSEFIITLDADHVPLQHFIESTLGYFDDPDVAFVQSPQTFYNTDSFLFKNQSSNKGWNEQMMFYECIQPAKNTWNAAFFVGTSAILRRAAIDAVGGFATGTATEDIHTSLRLHAAGWKSIFTPEVLAYGLEADSLGEFYKQRRRWAAGSLGLLFRSPDSPLRSRGLTLAQRLNYLSACLAHLQGVQKVCFFITPIAVVFTRISPVTTGFTHYGIVFMAYISTALLATWAYSRGTYHFLYTESYALASACAHIGGIRGILKVQKKFAVSLKSRIRRDKSRVVYWLWLLLIIALLGVARAFSLLESGFTDRSMIVFSVVFMLVNVVILSSFLWSLFLYQNRSVGSEVNNTLKPLHKYRYIALTLALENLMNAHETMKLERGVHYE